MDTLPLRERIQEDMKSTMRAGNKVRLGVIRFLMAAIKQKEIDNRPKMAGASLSEEEIIAVIDKLCKQRRESIEQYQLAKRDDLAQIEQAELEILLTFLPPPLSDSELTTIIDRAITQTQAQGINDMGKVMTEVKPQLQGRADMKTVSEQIKKRLQASASSV